MLERTYNIPLRKGFRLTARQKKTKKAVTVLKEFLAQHMKSDKIRIGKHLNEELWKHGIRNPPHHVKVSVIKDDDGIVKAELIGFKYEHKKKEQKESKEDKKPMEKMMEKVAGRMKKPEKTEDAENAEKETQEKTKDTAKESKPAKAKK